MVLQQGTVSNETFDRMIRELLEHGYCSITVYNYGLIRLIRFGSRICIYLSKGFANRLRLIRAFT